MKNNRDYYLKQLAEAKKYATDLIEGNASGSWDPGNVILDALNVLAANIRETECRPWESYSSDVNYLVVLRSEISDTEIQFECTAEDAEDAIAQAKLRYDLDKITIIGVGKL